MAQIPNALWPPPDGSTATKTHFCEFLKLIKEVISGVGFEIILSISFDLKTLLEESTETPIVSRSSIAGSSSSSLLTKSTLSELIHLGNSCNL